MRSLIPSLSFLSTKYFNHPIALSLKPWKRNFSEGREEEKEKEEMSKEEKKEEYVDIETLKKIQIRVGKVLAVEDHPSADRLFVLKFELFPFILFLFKYNKMVLILNWFLVHFSFHFPFHLHTYSFFFLSLSFHVEE